jgi:UDP-N-acetylglucosamine 4-epimerase
MLNDHEADFVKKTSFLVTGGAGFIGSNIVQFLSGSSAKKIRVLDDLSTGNFENIRKLSEENKIEFVKGDIRNAETCREACKGIDVVLHHAALGSVQRSILDPATTSDVNISGFLNMLVAAKENKVGRFIYASSSSVYGDDQHMPKREEKAGNLLSPYAVTKKSNEDYAKVFSALYDLSCIGLRYFNVFGPYQSVNGAYAAVIPLFIEAMTSGKPAKIFGDGENTRDFTYVDNVILANILAAKTELPDKISPVINIAFGGTTSLNTLHKLLSEFTGNKLPPVYEPFRKGDIRDSFADISKAKELIGYRSGIDIEEGLKKTTDWFLKKKKLSSS